MTKKAAKKAAQPQYTANQLFGAFMAVTISFLVLAMWPEMSETRGYDSMLKRMGIAKKGIKIQCSGAECGLVTKRQVEQGESLITIPTDKLIQVQTIMKEPQFSSVLDFESESLTAAFRAAELPKEAFFTQFVFTLKLWHEHKLGSSSELYQWMYLLPKRPNHVLYFDEEEVGCLDMITAMEVNKTRTTLQGFAKVVSTLCADEKVSLYSCSSLNPSTLEDELTWAYATFQQRTWGEARAPMIVPVVDFAYSHPDLCNPKGDKDVACSGRERQYFLRPNQHEDILSFDASFRMGPGEKVYTMSHNRAPWETLSIFGYADFAAAQIPDLYFMSRLQRFLQENQIFAEQMSEDHPLRKCVNRQTTSWVATGQATELRKCYSALFYFIEHPSHAKSWDEDARDAHTQWKEDAVAQLKSKYLASRAVQQAAQGIQQALAQPQKECVGEGRRAAIRDAYAVTAAFMGRARAAADRSVEKAFAKWAEKDESASESVAEPTAPEAGGEQNAAEDVVEDEAAEKEN